MLRVGIHENIVLNKTAKNDQGSLVLEWKAAGGVDPIAALAGGGSTSFDAESCKMIIYPMSNLNYSKELDTADNILKKIADLKDPLDHILAVYLTLDRRNAVWNPFKDTGVTTATKDLVRDEKVLMKIYDNITNQFISMAQPFVGENGKKLRVLFVRQSKAKHYPSLRKRFLETYPFVEDMNVPVSKLKFNDYEKQQGLDNGDVAGGAQLPSTADADQARTLFAQ